MEMWGSSLELARASARTRRDFPIPGSPDTSTTWPCAILYHGPVLEQERELGLATDQRRQAVAMEGLEAALGVALALNLASAKRLRRGP